MPGLNIESTSPMSVFRTLSANSYKKGIQYAMDEVELMLRQAEADAGGELLNPEVYDMGINQLEQIKIGLSDKDMIQSIDTKIARYRIIQNNLKKQIEKQARGSGPNVDEAIYDMKSELNQKKREIFDATYRDPGQFITAMADNMKAWINDLVATNDDYNARTGKRSLEIEKFIDELSTDYTKYNKLATLDPTQRSSYGVFLKTDNNGKIEDFDIKDLRESRPSNFALLDGVNKSGFGLYVNYNPDEVDEDGNVVTKLNGVPLTIADGVVQEMPAELGSGDAIFGNLNKSYPIISGNAGDIIETPDGKAYVFGGFDGKSGKWHYIADPEVTTKMGWWKNATDNKKKIGFDQIAAVDPEIFGFPLTIKKMDATQQNIDLQNLYSSSRSVLGNLFGGGPGGTGDQTWAEAGAKIKQGIGKVAGGAGEFPFSLGKAGSDLLKGLENVGNAGAYPFKKIMQSFQEKKMGRSTTDMQREGEQIFRPK
jgi:hypothetical protein